MRNLLAAAVFGLFATRAVAADDATLGTCEAAVGPWEFATQPGRALIANEGTKYHVVYLTQFADPGTGAVSSDGSASECTCAGTATVLTWTCQVAFALRASEIGATETYEWTVDQGVLRSWSVAPDGQRGRGIAIRRPR